ncbi:elongation factor P maturation arginine rhamnosyltransferase EarP [Niveibacterium sp. SC-1]|uniref:elongation factor P maturation arginine rhamnosyltransferase EarP n=1 Tax=Niveibacterium sp. SC-1 TaxID=3135646 RepID=UPI00311F173B
MPHSPPRRWDIFCEVIDNFGDAGVCWRLARQLAEEHGVAPRLFIDRPEALARLAPVSGRAGVEVVHWQGDTLLAEPAEVVIDAFGTRAPTHYVAAMAARRPQPVWINLEYLSAEPWVEGCHGLASPHPASGMPRWFFFPGFTAATGGLLREDGLPARMDAAAATSPQGDALGVSLFSYENAGLDSLLAAWANDVRRIDCVVPEGRVRAGVDHWLGASLTQTTTRGALTLDPQSFLPQPEYDALLARADLNFVRGEDSFVRAQWAGKPFIWQIYVQEQDAHLTKLAAFLDRYTAGLPDEAAGVLRDFHFAWNRGVGPGPLWPRLQAQLPILLAHAREWRAQLTQQLDLSTQLVRFAQSKLK